MGDLSSGYEYFEPSQSNFMINFRVENLDELLKALREEGVQVDPKVKITSTESSLGLWIRREIGGTWEAPKAELG